MNDINAIHMSKLHVIWNAYNCVIYIYICDVSMSQLLNIIKVNEDDILSLNSKCRVVMIIYSFSENAYRRNSEKVISQYSNCWLFTIDGSVQRLLHCKLFYRSLTWNLLKTGPTVLLAVVNSGNPPLWLAAICDPAHWLWPESQLALLWQTFRSRFWENGNPWQKCDVVFMWIWKTCKRCCLTLETKLKCRQ